MWWIPVVIFVGLGLATAVALELRERKRSRNCVENSGSAAKSSVSDGECCGQHALCERDLLLNKKDEIIYYDDDELDALSGISPDEYDEKQLHELEDVFYTLQEKDVAGWLRSLQLRNIALPDELRDEALLIVSERRRSGNQ